jgi:uncharacterized repeat protein (TIGR03803 family)
VSVVRFRAECALIVLCNLLSTTPTNAQVVLHTFTGFPSDGQGPVGSLVPFGSAFYGMTNAGGSAGNGTIFKMNPDGTGYTLLRSFLGGANDGSDPFGTLAQSGGVFYGMTEFGGSGGDGTIFKMNADGTGFGVVHSFQGGAADGNSPVGSPVVSAGVVYGMSSQGGTANLGVVYRMNPDGTDFQVIHSFTGGANDGQLPSFSAPVVSSGVIYGMTVGGGTAGQGVIYRMNADGTGFTVLHSFTVGTGDGYDPSGGLTLVGNTLYGMARQGGTFGVGTIFRINTDGTGYGLLHSFARSPSDGAQPVGTLFFDGTQLFGSTPRGGAFGVGSNNALGVLFGLNLDGSNYQVLTSFDGGLMGGGPADVIAYNGALYGMTGAGGSANDGVIYSLAVPEPSSFVLLAVAGAAAAIVRRRSKRAVRTESPPDKKGKTMVDGIDQPQ